MQERLEGDALPNRYMVDTITDVDGQEIPRFSTPYEHLSELVDPRIWHRKLSTGVSDHLSLAIVETEQGKRLYWAHCQGVAVLLNARDRAQSVVHLESDVAPVQDESGTYVPQRSIIITADGSVPGAAAEARELIEMLALSGVNADIPVAAYGIQPSFENPDDEQTQILLDTWL